MSTSLPLADRLGVLEPQIVHLPPDVASLAAAEEAIELAEAYGICRGHGLDESQQFTLRAGLGERADGSWAALTVGDFEPRQNGKNDTCAARELAGLVLFGEQLLIHTAHQFKTANESFIRMVAAFENHDDLRKKVRNIRYASGEQGIELLNGARLKYLARSGGSGRGFAEADLVVYDEAQHLQAEDTGASAPTRLANPNSQSWYMGSGGFTFSVNAWRMRRRALEHRPGRFAYVEHTAEKVRMVDGRVVSEVPADLMDREAWALANPAYGRRISDEIMLSVFEEIGADLFPRECLCIWEPEPVAHGTVIPADKWQVCTDAASVIVSRPCFAFDVSIDRTWATICTAGFRSDGLSHVEVVDHRQGTGWVAKRIDELVERWRPMMVACDPAGPAGGVLSDVKADVQLVGTREATQACGMFYDDVIEGRLRHLNQPELNVAVSDADKRPVGDAWLWSRKGSFGVISPLVAATLARWALGNAPDDTSVYEDRELVTL